MMEAKQMRLTVIGLVLVCTVATWANPSVGAVKSKLVQAAEPGWSQWRGPRRDGVSDETSLLASWPEGGPKVLWTAGALGKGWSSPVLSKDAIYITGDVGEEFFVDRDDGVEMVPTAEAFFDFLAELDVGERAGDDGLGGEAAGVGFAELIYEFGGRERDVVRAVAGGSQHATSGVEQQAEHHLRQLL